MNHNCLGAVFKLIFLDVLKWFESIWVKAGITIKQLIIFNCRLAKSFHFQVCKFHFQTICCNLRLDVILIDKLSLQPCH